MSEPASPASWHIALADIAQRSWQRLIVIGAPDRGKSSFCDGLARQMRSGGMKTALLDTALAEKLVGPPACVTLGQLGPEIYALDDLYFTGGLDGPARSAKVIAGAACLAARTSERLIIDTSGSFNPPGRLLKSLLVDTLQPDLIVALSLDDELRPYLPAFPQARLIELATPAGVTPRNAMARGLERLKAFQAEFADARKATLRNIAVEVWDNDAFDWSEGEYICGVAAADGTELGLGILHPADVKGVAFEISTRVAPDKVSRLRVGIPLPDELKS